MNQDHAANIAAKVPPGVPPGDWRWTALDAAPGHSHGAGSAPWEWPGPGGVDGRRQKCGGTARVPGKKSDKFSQVSDRVSNCYGTDGPTPTSTVHTRDRLRMEYARLDHCRYEGKWYQRCRNWWTPKRDPTYPHRYPHGSVLTRVFGHTLTNPRICDYPREPRAAEERGSSGRRKGGAYTLTRAFRRSLGSWI